MDSPANPTLCLFGEYDSFFVETEFGLPKFDKKLNSEEKKKNSAYICENLLELATEI